MKKYILTLCTLCCLATTLQAQIIVTSTSVSTTRPKLYRGDITVGGLVGGHSGGLEITTVHGAQINNWFFAGLSCGFVGTWRYPNIKDYPKTDYYVSKPTDTKSAYSSVALAVIPAAALRFTLPVSIPKLETSPFVETQIGLAAGSTIGAYFNLKVGFDIYKTKFGNLQCFVGYKLIPDGWDTFDWAYKKVNSYNSNDNTYAWYLANDKRHDYSSHFSFGVSFEFGSGLERIGK